MLRAAQSPVPTHPATMSSSDRPVDPGPPLSGKVLYVEDVEANRALVGALLAPHAGITYLTATTGAEGISRIRAERPDWVLLDMHLPDMSGLQVVRELNPDIAELGLRVTILTADDLSMDILKAMSLGAFEHWVKPINVDAFEAGLRRALAARKPTPR
jgi:CheY-like chemotaxis protein